MESSSLGKNTQTWLGKVVGFESQKDQVSGKGWGSRYKVRIFESYAERDNIEDAEVHYATTMFSVTDGSGGAGRMKTSKITQGDMVFGYFMAPDKGFPVIAGVLGRTKDKVNSGGKFGSENGFTVSKKPGLTGRQEVNETNGPCIPQVKPKGSGTGTGKGKAIPKSKFLNQMGIDTNLPSQLNAIAKPLSQIQNAASGQLLGDIASAATGELTSKLQDSIPDKFNLGGGVNPDWLDYKDSLDGALDIF